MGTSNSRFIRQPLWVSLGLLFIAIAPSIADEPEKKSDTLSIPSSGVPEDPLQPFTPAAPVTDEEKEKLEAKKLLVIGLGQVSRRQNLNARRTFEKVLELDPKNLTALQEIVPLALQASDTRAALDYGRRSLELDPNDYQLLHVLSTLQAQAGKLPEAVEMLKKASAIKGVAEEDPREFLQIRSDLAQYLTTLGRVEEAIEPLRDILEYTENPDKHDLGEFAKKQLERRKFQDYEQLSRALAKTGRFKEAVEILDNARKKDEKGKRLAVVIAEIAYDQGDYERAARELETFIALGSQNREAFQKYADVLDKLGRKKDLLGQLERWMEVDGDNQVLGEFYAEQLIEAGEYEQAQQQLRRLRGRASSLDLTAKLYRKMGEPKKLLELMTQAVRTASRMDLVTDQIEAISKDPELVAKLAECAREIKPDSPDNFFASFLVADMAIKAKNTDVAIEFLNRCLNDKTRPADGQIYFTLVELLSDAHRHEDVVKIAEQAEKANPGQKILFLEYRARALESLGRGDEATQLLEDFAKEHKGNDEVITARLALARIFLQREAFDDAIKICRDTITEFPNHVQGTYAKYLLATILGQKGEMAEFEKLMLELLDNTPNLPPAFTATLSNDLGYTWAEHDMNLDKAETLIRKALNLKPDEPAYLDSLGWVQFKRGDFEGAVKSLKQASESTSGQDAVIFEHLGDAYLKVQKPKDAEKAWKRAIELLSDTRTNKAKQQREQIEKKMKMLVGETSGASR
jgi:tetratricopeptide (TPR) repeat protein